jgi:geranylgeranyl pyrophosphate synthase
LDLGNLRLLDYPVRYSLDTKGKRLRPLICVLCSEIAGGDYTKTGDAFVALELIHNGTLVHDDLIDEDDYRRGKTSVHTLYGNKRAVLAGDALLSLSLRYATKTGKLEIVDQLAETAFKMVQGVALQTHYRRKVIPLSAYVELAYLKSGSLFESAAVIGAMVGGISGEERASIERFGRNFGIAYQIKDDITDIRSSGEGTTRSDIANGDISLPFIFALQSANITSEDRGYLMDVFSGERSDYTEADVLRIYNETGSLDASITEMNKYAEAANVDLSGFNGDAGGCLRRLIKTNYSDFRFQTVSARST